MPIIRNLRESVRAAFVLAAMLLLLAATSSSLFVSANNSVSAAEFPGHRAARVLRTCDTAEKRECRNECFEKKCGGRFKADKDCKSKCRDKCCVEEQQQDPVQQEKQKENTKENTKETPETETEAAPAAGLPSPIVWESLSWPQRGIVSRSNLDVDAFDQGLADIAENNCDIGVTATLFDGKNQQIYQKTVGSIYVDVTAENVTEGWNADTQFVIYSNSKVIIALLFMATIVDAGLGSLDDPLSRLIPEMVPEGGDIGNITPRMILSHTSGICTDADVPAFNDCRVDPDKSLDDCLEDIFNTPLCGEPGTEFVYNNMPFYILAYLIPTLAGYENLEEALQAAIATPLGMSNTSYDCPLVESTESKPHVSWGICSTGNDMPKIVHLLANQGKSQDGKQILTEASARMMLQSQTGIATGVGTKGIGDLNYKRCKTGIPSSIPGQDSSIVGYGLGTKIIAGAKGQVFAHAAAAGGYWFVAPGRFSAYFAFQSLGGRADFTIYQWIFRLLDVFEEKSKYEVMSDLHPWQEVETCSPYTDPAPNLLWLDPETMPSYAKLQLC